MGYTKTQLLAHLKELQIDFATYEHPVVLTVEAQAKYVGHLRGSLSKNLLLKDKKHRYYVISALAGTNVDLKVMSQRLGLGKGGLRMAPEEALQEILQVPLGCVTPLALINESARAVSLLLDQAFKAEECCFFHPLSNDTTISLSASNLDKFLMSIGRNPSYVNLEAETMVGKDNPPDLAAFVPVDVPQCSEQTIKAAVNVREQKHAPLEKKLTNVQALSASNLNKFLMSIGRNPSYVNLEVETVVGKDNPPDLVAFVPVDVPQRSEQTIKAAVNVREQKHAPLEKKLINVQEDDNQSRGSQKAIEKPCRTADILAEATDVNKFIKELIEKTSLAVLSEMSKDSKAEGREPLESAVLDGVNKRISSDLENLAMILKNAAYTQGFQAGIQSRSPRR